MLSLWITLLSDPGSRFSVCSLILLKAFMYPSIYPPSTIHWPKLKKKLQLDSKEYLSAYLLDHRVIPPRERRRAEGKGGERRREEGVGREEFRWACFLVFHLHTPPAGMGPSDKDFLNRVRDFPLNCEHCPTPIWPLGTNRTAGSAP